MRLCIMLLELLFVCTSCTIYIIIIIILDAVASKSNSGGNDVADKCYVT